MSIVTVRIEELKEYTKKLGFNVNTICLDYPSKDTIIVGNDILTNVHSCAKTITALAFGFLMQESSISIEDKVISFFPEYKEIASKGTDKIRIKHLMNMSSGKSLKSLLQRCNNDLYENDWLYWFFETPIQFYPGKSFYYSSHCCYVLGRIIEKISKKKVNDYLDEKLWRKLKIQKPIWSDCPKGHTNCAGNLWLKCSDLAKIGNLLLQKGIYKNTQLLHASYIELMINKTVNSNDPFIWNDTECSCGYGFFIWKCSRPNTYRIWGAGANFCIIDYAKKVVLSITANRNDNWLKYNDHTILREAYKILDLYEMN